MRLKKEESLKTIYIEVKDDYVSNVLKMLDDIKGVMINKIKLEPSDNPTKIEDPLMMLQITSMEETWDNDKDKAWDAL